MIDKKVLIVKNVHRESPGLIKTVLDEYGIPIRLYNPHSHNMKFPNPNDYSAVIVLGGPQSANDLEMQNELEFIARTTGANIPCFGVCLGMQALVRANGGGVVKADYQEVGCRDKKGNIYIVELTSEGKTDPLFRSIPHRFPIFQLHGETVFGGDRILLLGEGDSLYSTAQEQYQVVKVGKNAYGIQGHLEVTPSMLERWLQSDKMFDSHDKDTIRQDFKKLEPQYSENGRRIIINFLRIAHLVN